MHAIFVFLVWATLLRKIFWSSILFLHISWSHLLFFFKLSNIPMCKCTILLLLLFYPLFSVGTFRLFLVSGYCNKASVIMFDVWASALWTSVQYMLRSGVARSWSKSIPYFLRNHHIDFPSVSTSYLSYPGILFTHIKLKIVLLRSIKNCAQILMKIALNL